jgi:hypothetical protein
MEIVVIFCYPDIADPDGDEATAAIESLTINLKNAGVDCDTWHIDEVLGDSNTLTGDE